MKKIWILFLGANLLLTLNCLAQTIVESQNEPGFFAKFGTWATGGAITLVVGIIAGILKKKGLMPKIKLISGLIAKFSKKAANVAKEASEVLEDISETATDFRDAIKDDGTFDTSKIDEIKEDIKEVIKEGGDVINAIKDK